MTRRKTEITNKNFSQERINSPGEKQTGFYLKQHDTRDKKQYGCEKKVFGGAE